jgi:hypothetical protein
MIRVTSIHRIIQKNFTVFFIFANKKARGEILAKQWLIGELQLLKYWGFIIPSIKVTINILQHNILVYVNININRFNILITLCEIGCTEIRYIILEILCSI